MTVVLTLEKVSRFDRKTSKGVHRLFRGFKFQRGFKMNSSGVLFTQVSLTFL